MIASLEVFPAGTRRDPDGTLVIGGCWADELARTYGTPALVVDEGHLRATARRYRAALEAAWPDSQVTYASKAFPATAVYRLMAQEGIWIDVAGAGELELALAPGVSLYRVVSVKRSATTFVAVDGGMGDNLEVSLYGQPFEAVIAAQAEPGARELETCDVVGHHCESGDRLVVDIALPRPRVGDLLAVPVTGAYTYPLSNNYNGALRPHRAVIRRETFADLARRDVAENRRSFVGWRP